MKNLFSKKITNVNNNVSAQGALDPCICSGCSGCGDCLGCGSCSAPCVGGCGDICSTQAGE
jgi:hypothetical protein